MWKVLCKIKQTSDVTAANEGDTGCILLKGKSTLNLFSSLKWPLIASVVSHQGKSICHNVGAMLQYILKWTFPPHIVSKSWKESQAGHMRRPTYLKSGRSSPSLWLSSKCFRDFYLEKKKKPDLPIFIFSISKLWYLSCGHRLRVETWINTLKARERKRASPL